MVVHTDTQEFAILPNAVFSESQFHILFNIRNYGIHPMICKKIANFWQNFFKKWVCHFKTNGCTTENECAQELWDKTIFLGGVSLNENEQSRLSPVVIDR